jgi:Double zinc ribbon
MSISSMTCPKCGAGVPEQIYRGKLFKCSHCESTLVWPEKQATIALSFGANLCPACGMDNSPTRPFCRNCGTTLTKVCPECGTAFYIGDNFCPNGHDFERLAGKSSQQYALGANIRPGVTQPVAQGNTSTRNVGIACGCLVLLCLFMSVSYAAYVNLPAIMSALGQ